MRIRFPNSKLVTEISFLNAGRRSGDFYVDRLPVHEMSVDRLPHGMSAIIATADLQGREQLRHSPNSPPRLLGEVLPELLATVILPLLGLKTERIGVLLAGDFYTVPALDRRGGSGDVSDVWWAFADQFDWVAGVAGNHDTFGDDPNGKPSFGSRKLHYLDQDRANIDGLRIAGLGGIIGNPRRPRRRSDEDYARALRKLLAGKTDILLMHDGPDAPIAGYRGNPVVREIIEQHRPSLVVRGHCHWPEPLVEIGGGVQVLNVDSRVVILRD